MSAELNRIHQAALSKFQYVSDQSRFNTQEHWMVPDELKVDLQCDGTVFGDCDDFAAYCVMECRQQNIPARFVMCRCENGELHLVCESDGWILDNRQPIVCRQDDLPYQWISISGFKPGDPWHSIKE